MNLNPKATRILFFGDSNTWGYVPNSAHERYPLNVRWTGLLQKVLGDNFEVIEEGLNSRGIVKGDPRPGKEGRSAIEYIIPCLDTHDPLDCVIVMLGTNELKSECNLSPVQIGENMEILLGLIQNRPSQFRSTRPNIVLVAPPLVDEETEYCRKGDKYKGASQKSRELGKIFADLANKLGIRFLDLGQVASVGLDGIHMTPEGHRATAESLARLF